jgi:hypothetical protein
MVDVVAEFTRVSVTTMLALGAQGQRLLMLSHLLLPFLSAAAIVTYR